MRTLTLNTYGGSLLLGANAIRGSRIIGSYEDVGFGANITRANVSRFNEREPGFEFIDHLKNWPDQDLTDTIVLAHPPCAAFSQQNTSAAKRGVNTSAFDCTRKVLRYSMMNGAAAIAVESVMGALAGAWDVYDHMAGAGGYHVYRILKNSILFGVPQFRERFWAVLVRKDLASTDFKWTLSPKFVNIWSVLDPVTPGTPVEGTDRTVSKFITKLVNEHGLDESKIRQIGLAEIAGYKRQGFSLLIQKEFFPDVDPKLVCRKYVSPFTSAQPSVLAPWGFAPVLLGSSLWIYKGTPVSQEGYKRIMGFPTKYIFPPDKAHGIRTMLSKGVCPPVATWILDNIRIHLGMDSASSFTQPGGWTKTIQPGRVASFRPSRQAILTRYEEMMKLGAPESDELLLLRDEEADLEEDDEA